MHTLSLHDALPISLLEGGAYPDDTDLTGRTALDWAKAKRFKRIEDLLIENGAYN